jgi:hypothetical protein
MDEAPQFFAGKSDLKNQKDIDTGKLKTVAVSGVDVYKRPQFTKFPTAFFLSKKLQVKKVHICKKSSKLLKDSCPVPLYNQVFPADTAVSEPCDEH